MRFITKMIKEMEIGNIIMPAQLLLNHNHLEKLLLIKMIFLLESHESGIKMES